MLTQNNGRKMPIFVTPCILPSHTGFKNIFIDVGINQQTDLINPVIDYHDREEIIRFYYIGS